MVLTRRTTSALTLLGALLAQGLACSQETRQFDAGGAGGEGGGAGTGGAGGGALVEDCLNGDDDDADGKRDCDDEDCWPGFECVPPAPEGWVGPVSLYKGPPAEAPTCPTELPDTIYDGYAELADEPALCSACACDAANVSVSCNLGPLEAYTVADCMGSKNLSGQNNGIGVCSLKSVQNSPKSFRAMVPFTSASGACPPSQAEVTLPPPAWASIALACSRPDLGKGCGSQVCAPRGKPPFEAALCIVQKGDLECPAPYLTRHAFTDDPTDVVDARGCEPCTCNPPMGSCSAVTTLYSSPVCDGISVVVPNDASCVAGLGINMNSQKVELTKSASCEPAGGAPTGSVTPAKKTLTTVCCLP